MMKLRKNNRGFTLVELIVSTAILSIVALAASAFMVAGSRTYSSLNYTVRLQYEAQIVMAQLQEYTVDCTDGIAWDGTTLYVVNGADVHLFKFDSTRKVLSYGKAVKADTLTASFYDLAEHINAMDVELDEGQVEISLEMQRNSKTYSATQLIALRNRPEYATSWSQLKDKI